MAPRKQASKVNGFSADLYRELGELKQSFKDHLEEHSRERVERHLRQVELNGRLDSIDKKLMEATDIKRGMAILLKIVAGLTTIAGLGAAFLKIKQLLHR